jgi:bacillithiol biosynthesis cysteine-adding enzyme BshC
MPQAHYLPYAATRRFAPLVLDYLAGKDALKDLYRFRPDRSGLRDAVQQRREYPIDRSTLVTVLREQYHHLSYKQQAVTAIGLLESENTFSVCTAHQPNLATGYLYFAYKILHAIKLAQDLKAQYPDLNFVPVYYMGSEDADLDELGTFRFAHKKFVWDANGQRGAVGRMSTDSLAPLLHELTSLFGPPGLNAETLTHLLHEAYLNHDTVGRATQHLVHELFGHYGLVVLDPDDARLKQSFVPIMEMDLLQHTSEGLVNDTVDALAASGYKAQAFPRPINLFYLRHDIRERIEEHSGRWQVLNTDLSFNREELLDELHQHPERFSPNVMLRPLYQETILPNVAFIGGGAEVSYWLQLKNLFAHHHVFYPAILLRQSVMWVDKSHLDLKAKTTLSYEALFASRDEAARSYVSAQKDWTLPAEHDQLEVLLSSLKEKAAAIDPTLSRSADAVLVRMQKQLKALEGKMLRALKKQEATSLDRIARLQESLFPNGGLAERVENFMPYYLEYGPAFFDWLLAAIDPLRAEFLILEAD